jgi:hypothetical protein
MSLPLCGSCATANPLFVKRERGPGYRTPS